jgi:hypothetical protein
VDAPPNVEHSQRVHTSVLHCPTGRRTIRSAGSTCCGSGRRTARAKLVEELTHRMPGAVRYLLRGLGPDAAETELASYLLFDTAFCGKLIELGRHDVAAERERIARFFDA